MGIIDSRYTINGLLNPRNAALSNLAKLANAAGAWMTYDTHAGKFAVVINKAGTSQWHFTDDNIIGSINIAFTPLDKLYNTAKVTYPHEDLKGNTDWIQISIPQADRMANEFENVLMIEHDIVTNPVQAELLGFIELKQSRVDKVVTFKTDYSMMGIKAGDLFDITNSVYGWTEKVFRVISVAESDKDDGTIEITITGLEYDESVYDEDLTRYIRTDSSGIIPLASLSPPTKPIVTPNELVSRPYVKIDTSLIDGIVTSIELWSSTDVTLADNLRSYSLLKTITTGDTLPLNTTISTEVDSVSASTFVVKARAVNSDGVSLFSLPSDTAYYQGTQVTDAVNQGTEIIDPAGGNLLNSLGISLLLKLLNGLFGGADGTAPANEQAVYRMLQSMTSAGGLMVSASAGNVTNANVAHGSNQLVFTSDFIPKVTGTYIVSAIIDQNGSGALGGRGPDFGEDDDTIIVYMETWQGTTKLTNESSGGTGSFYWTDYAMSSYCNLTAGVTYTFSVYADVLTESVVSPASFTTAWSIYTVA